MNISAARRRDEQFTAADGSYPSADDELFLLWPEVGKLIYAPPPEVGKIS